MSDKIAKNPRLGTVGGQAVMEGVMMKSKDSVAISVRRGNGEIVKKLKGHTALIDKYKLSKVPLVRGFINFIDMMKLAMGTLTEAAEMVGFDDEGETAGEENTQENVGNAAAQPDAGGAQANKKKEDSKMIAAAAAVGVALGLALSFALFFFLPTFIGSAIESAVTDGGDAALHPALRSMFEGVVRLAIFIAYILLVSQVPDIKRTFEYHGAEHMSIYAYEQNEELTVENARRYPRFHPRCGTSFLIIMILIGFVVGMILPSDELWLRLATRLAIFPVVIGVAFEFIKFAGKHSDNIIVKIISAPGIWVQRLTTRRPNDEQLEVAVASLKLALKLETVEESDDEHNAEIEAGGD